MQGLDISHKIPHSTRRRKNISNTPEFRRKLLRFEMSYNEADTIESAASRDGHAPKEDDLEAKKAASEKESTLRSS